jgi:hypothetical protein
LYFLVSLSYTRPISQVAEAELSEARGQIQAGANLALAAQAACEELLLHCAAAVDELVAGQDDVTSDVTAGLLARHVLPQVCFRVLGFYWSLQPKDQFGVFRGIYRDSGRYMGQGGGRGTGEQLGRDSGAFGRHKMGGHRRFVGAAQLTV